MQDGGLHPVPGQLEGDQGAQVEAAHGAPGAPLPQARAEVPRPAAERLQEPRALAHEQRHDMV